MTITKTYTDPRDPGVTQLGADRSRLIRNMTTNALSTALTAISGLITLPLLIARMGAESYGLWVLIVATTGLFTMMDFGVSAGVGRLIAAHHHDRNQRAIGSIVSTALVLLCGLAVLMMIVTVAVAEVFSSVFQVPAEKAQDVFSALLMSGAASAVYFPSSISDAILWGRERFDLHNAVEIPVLLVRFGAIVALVDNTTTLT